MQLWEMKTGETYKAVDFPRCFVNAPLAPNGGRYPRVYCLPDGRYAVQQNSWGSLWGIRSPQYRIKERMEPTARLNNTPPQQQG